jgi:hypothetical protein
MMKILFTILGLFLMSLVSRAQQENKEDVLPIKSSENFDISGDGKAAEWNATEWVTLEKRKGVSTYHTRAKLLYSKTGIYGLFSCEDKKITATLKEDFSNLWTEDVIEIFFWPDESVALYFEYELSPLNHELAILVPNMDGDFLGWRPWRYEGTRRARHATKIVMDESGDTKEWLAEFFIPYSLLKPLRNVPPKKGTEWRMNMYRIDYDQEQSSWSWKPVEKSFHDYKKFGSVRFD